MASVSSMWMGSGSPSRASGAASPSSLSSSQASKLPDGNDSSDVFGCAPLNVAYLIGETKVLAIDPALARSTPDGSSGGGHGTLHQVIWQSSGLRLSLLRSHCHSPQRSVCRHNPSSQLRSKSLWMGKC